MNCGFTLAITGQSLIKHDIRQIMTPAVENVRALLRKADLAFTNFEGTILGRHGGWPLKGSYFGASEPIVLDALQTMGFTALALSNNHAFDLGPSGVLSTLEEVEQRGFLHAGLGRDQAEAGLAATGYAGGRRVAIVAMDGGPGPDFMYAADGGAGRPARPGVNRLRLSQLLEVDGDAFEQIRAVRDKVGYSGIDLINDSQPDDPLRLDLEEEVGFSRSIFRRSDGFRRNVRIDEGDLKRNLTTISAAADSGSLVIAYLHHHHWARNWHDVPDWVGRLARQCIDAGAILFASHGAPVLQPVEIYRDRPIFYSLGNFIFHVRSEKSNWTAPEVWESVVAVLRLSTTGETRGLEFHPIVLGGEAGLGDDRLERRLTPERVNGSAAERILSRLRDRSASLGASIEIAGGIATLQI